MLLGTGLFTGKNGMMVVMLITSVVLIWLGLMALRMRIAIINSLGEASSNLLEKFVMPTEGGGGGGSGSLSGALSASSGGGGGASQVIGTTMQSAGATAGSTLTKAALTGGAVMGGGALAGKLSGGGGGSDDHGSIATGDGSDGSEMTAVAGKSGKDGMAAEGKDGEAAESAEAGSVSAVVSSYSSGSSMGTMSQEALDKQQAASLMQADSLASANGMSESSLREARASQAGPASGMMAGDAVANAEGASGADGLAVSEANLKGAAVQEGQGHTVGESAAYAKAQEGNLSANLDQNATAQANASQADLKTAQAADSYMAIGADGQPVMMPASMDASMSGTMNGTMSGTSDLRGVQVGAGAAGEAGLSGVGVAGQAGQAGMANAYGAAGLSGSATSTQAAADARAAQLRGVRSEQMMAANGLPGQDGVSSGMASGGRDIRGLSVGQAAANARAQAEGAPGQGRGSLDRSRMGAQADMGRYRNSSLAHERVAQAMPAGGEGMSGAFGTGSAGQLGAAGSSMAGMPGASGRGTGMGSQISSRSSSHSYRNSLSHADSRYTSMPGGNSLNVHATGGAGGAGVASGGRGGVGTGYGAASTRNAGMPTYRPGAMDANRKPELDRNARMGTPGPALDAPTAMPGVRGVNVGNAGLSGGRGTGSAPGQFGRPNAPQGNYRRDTFR